MAPSSRRITRWLGAVGALALLASLGPFGIARAADDPRIKIDYDPPNLSIDAHRATLAQILSEIGSRVGFTLVDSRASSEPLDVSIQRSPVDEVLRRLLRGENHTVVYATGGGAGIDTIVLLGGPGIAASSNGASSAGGASAPGRVDPSVTTAPPTSQPMIPVAPEASSVAEASSPPSDVDQPGPTNAVGNILKSHALSAAPAAQQASVAAPPSPQPMTPDLLAETTRRAQQDLSALIEGLAAATRSLQSGPAGVRK